MGIWLSIRKRELQVYVPLMVCDTTYHSRDLLQ